VKKLPEKFCKCHGQVTFTELSATVPRAATVLPEYASRSLENPVGGVQGSSVQEMFCDVCWREFFLA